MVTTERHELSCTSTNQLDAQPLFLVHSRFVHRRAERMSFALIFSPWMQMPIFPWSKLSSLFNSILGFACNRRIPMSMTTMPSGAHKAGLSSQATDVQTSDAGHLITARHLLALLQAWPTFISSLQSRGIRHHRRGQGIAR
jgi:hypothetical protein